MFRMNSDKLNSLILNFNPLTNVYGLARSFIALGTLITLLISSTDTLFRPMAGLDNFPTGFGRISLFNIVPGEMIYLAIIKWVFIACLLLIISGWRPRYTGVLHWYIVYSINSSAATLDGGDQAAVVFTLLLIPITLIDSRKWHWQNVKLDSYNQKIFAIVPYYMIRFQVAVLYFHATIAKLFNEDWRNGTAVYYYLNDPMLGLNDFFLKLVNPILESPLVVIPTWGTLIVQFLLVFALFAPKSTWKYYLVVGIFMHEIFSLMLGLVSFSTIMIGVLILYLRPLEQPFNLKRGGAYLNRGKVTALKRLS